ncbi:nucleolar protein [Coemansia sp. Benny D115]|nr:nucleolar protein [Coemansia sp. Benny D115]
MVSGKKGGASKKIVSKAAAAPVEKKAKAQVVTKKVEEPEVSEEEEEEEEDIEEETIYEEMSDDSALEEVSSEEEDNVSGDEEEEEEENEEEGEEVDGSDIDEEALIAGLNGSDSEGEEDSSDEFSNNAPKISLDSKAGKEVMRQLEALREKAHGQKTSPGVIYVGRIPHGFYEEEMKGYFSQFGDILDLRMSRNPKTNRSRNYAFIKFAHKKVAEIVANTMNNYLMFDKLLKCTVVPEERVHKKMFTIRKKEFVSDKGLKTQRKIQEKPKTKEEAQKQIDRIVKAEDKKRKKLAAAGIDYDFPGYKGLRLPKAKHVKF